LQRERERYTKNPFFLLSAASNENNAENTASGTAIVECNKPPATSSNITNSSKKLSTKSSKDENLNGTKVPVVTQSFVDRYESEIAPPARFKEYEAIALKHKDILLKESKALQAQYSEDMKEAFKMETTVNRISSYLSEFVQILQSQRDLVDDVHTASKVATQHVKQTDTELTTTIERTESHSRYMVILTVGLAIMLLILDFVTP
jgi:hypothetical protein